MFGISASRHLNHVDDQSVAHSQTHMAVLPRLPCMIARERDMHDRRKAGKIGTFSFPLGERTQSLGMICFLFPLPRNEKG